MTYAEHRAAVRAAIDDRMYDVGGRCLADPHLVETYPNRLWRVLMALAGTVAIVEFSERGPDVPPETVIGTS